jgi:vesicle-fusing ATPase
MQARYTTHRTTRNAQQKVKLLDEKFPGPSIDPILLRLSDPTVEPGYVDPRHCLVFWGRPTQKIKQLILRIQQDLLTVAPSEFAPSSRFMLGLLTPSDLWLMPQDCLHITALEVTHSKKAEEIQKLVDTMREKIPSIANYTHDHRVRLIKPMIGFDASALALSFVPAAGEGLMSGSGRTVEDDKYTYHHLRRDLFSLCQDSGVSVDSRYVVPSSHLTIGRFINPKDFEDDAGAFAPQKMETFVEKIEEINTWLEKNYWPDYNNEHIPDGGDWLLGEEQGLVCRMGTLW